MLVPRSVEENDAWVTNQSIEPRYPQPDRAAVEARRGACGAGWVASDSIFTYWSTPRHPLRGWSPDRHPRSCRPQHRPLDRPPDLLARVRAPYKRASSPSFLPLRLCLYALRARVRSARVCETRTLGDRTTPSEPTRRRGDVEERSIGLFREFFLSFFCCPRGRVVFRCVRLFFFLFFFFFWLPFFFTNNEVAAVRMGWEGESEGCRGLCVFETTRGEKAFSRGERWEL